MKRYRQTLEELLDALSPVDTSWLDAHAEDVIGRLKSLPVKQEYSREDLIQLLSPENAPEDTKPKEYFEAGLTVIRLFLDLSKDEFTGKLRDRLKNGAGIKRIQNDPAAYYSALEDMGKSTRTPIN